MRVRALEMGFFGGCRRRPGQEFDVPQGMSAPWFVPVEMIEAPKAKAGKKAQEPTALSQLGNQPARSMIDVMGSKDDDAQP